LKNFNKQEFKSNERLFLSAIFFLFGLSIMSLAPRTPDLKANLGVNNGTFGTLLSTASLGSIVMLLIGGHIVHHIGSKRAMQIGSTIIASSFIVLVHTSSSLVFVIFNILSGGAISIYHIASSGHALHRQDEVGKVIVPKLHGAWGLGAMSTAGLAFLLTSKVSIAWHISVLMLLVWSATQFTIHKLTPTFHAKSDSDDKYELTSLKQFKFKVNWFLSIGFFCASLMEFTIADWATLFGKEVLGMSQSTSALNYLVYLLGLIIGRFSIGWALKHGSESFWIKAAGGFGGGGFIILLLISTSIHDSQPTLSYLLNFLGFLIGGLGSSFLAPIFFAIAGRLSNGQNAIAVGRLSFMNTLLIFNSKFILAWIVQLTTITVALLIAGASMLLLIYFGKIGSTKRV
jgi:MFS family permease